MPLAKLNEDPSKMISDIYDWSCHLTAESRRNCRYFWPVTTLNLLHQLRIVNGSLVCLSALQGTGKSAALQQLSLALPKRGMKVVSIKWPGGKEWRKTLHNELLEIADYRNQYLKHILEKIQVDSTDLKRLEKLRSEISQVIKNSDAGNILALEKYLDKEILLAEIDKSLVFYMSQRNSILIDLRDYSTTDTRMLNSDLTSIQEMWNEIARSQSTPKPNIVLALQKEISEKRPNFFIGKFSVLVLPPLKPEELVKAYKLQWGNTHPFTAEALLLIAKLARGVFRRFLRYISLLLEKSKIITIDTVKKIIKPKEIAKDMEQELKQTFPKSPESQKKAAALLYLLSLENGVAQKAMAKKLDANEMDVSRITEKLESGGYLRREQGRGRTKILALNVE